MRTPSCRAADAGRRAAGPASPTTGPDQTIPGPRATARPDLTVRDFQPDPAGLDSRRCGDITCIPTGEGRLRPATVIDIAARRGTGRATPDHLRTEPVADALTAACPQRRPTHPVLHRPVELAQYTGQQFAVPADQFGIRLPAGRTGQCWDNTLAESFFATVKRELLDTTARPSRAAARTAIFAFIGGPRCPMGILLAPVREGMPRI